jgi:hypothetical protein
MTFLALILECDRTERGRTTDTLELRYEEIGNMVRATPDEVRGIVDLAVSLKLLSINRERDGVTHREHVRVTLLERPKWAPRQLLEARPIRDQPRRIPTDERVLGALVSAGAPLSGRDLSDSLGLLYSGSFRARLKRLREAGRIVQVGKDYAPGEDV